MKKILCLLVLIFAIFVSCNKNNKGSVSQEINAESTESNNQDSIYQEYNTEIEYKEDDYKFSVGNISVSVMRRNKFKGINVCETLTLSRYVIDDTQFEHRIIFIDNEYCYIMQINFAGLGFDSEIREELPDYFNDDGGFIKKSAIYNQFINFQKMPDYIERLFTESMSIMNTM